MYIIFSDMAESIIQKCIALNINDAEDQTTSAHTHTPHHF
jgi:hypothetical protein